MALTHCLVLEDFWITPVWVFSSKLPHIKKWLPVDVWQEPFHVVILDKSASKECGSHWKKTGISLNLQKKLIWWCLLSLGQWDAMSEQVQRANMSMSTWNEVVIPIYVEFPASSVFNRNISSVLKKELKIYIMIISTMYPGLSVLESIMKRTKWLCRTFMIKACFRHHRLGSLSMRPAKQEYDSIVPLCWTARQETRKNTYPKWVVVFLPNILVFFGYFFCVFFFCHFVQKRVCHNNALGCVKDVYGGLTVPRRYFHSCMSSVQNLEKTQSGFFPTNSILFSVSTLKNVQLESI